MREYFVQTLEISFQDNQKMQGRESYKEVQHEVISHGYVKSSHAMRNSNDNNFKENLGHFLESIVYMLYIILNFGNSGVQRFKQCAIWS